MTVSKMLSLFSRVTQQLADYHHLVVSVMVAIEPRSIPMSKQGTYSTRTRTYMTNFILGNPQRQRAAEMLLQEKFKTILISYNS